MSGEIHGRPTAVELIDATIGFLRDQLSDHLDATLRHQVRIAVHALEIVQREIELGLDQDGAHQDRLHELGYEDDAGLAGAIRAGSIDDSPRLRQLLRDDTRDRLLVANPRWLPPEESTAPNA